MIFNKLLQRAKTSPSLLKKKKRGILQGVARLNPLRKFGFNPGSAAMKKGLMFRRK